MSAALRVALLVLALGLAASGAVRADETPTVVVVAETPPPRTGGGGEIRVVIARNEIPADLVSTGLVTVDSTGRLIGGLAERWSTADRGLVWRFALRPILRYADGSLIPLTDIIASLKRPLLRSILRIPIREIRADSEALVIRMKSRDAALPRRLAHPLAGIRAPQRESTGPFREMSRHAEKIVLVANPHAAVPARPDTVVLIVERDVARGVYLVEAGEADVAKVGDEDLARLLADPGAGRLVAGQTRDVHMLLPGTMKGPTLALVRGIIDRDVIVKTLLNGRGEMLGPAAQPLTPVEKSRLAGPIAIRDDHDSSFNTRLLPRVLYDLKRAGLACELTAGPSPSLRYAALPEMDLPSDAQPLYAVTPYWYVHKRIRNFEPPRAGRPGILAAEVAP